MKHKTIEYNSIPLSDRLKYMSSYLSVRTDIISTDVNRWLGYNKNQLPTFEEYYTYCIIDKGGSYDFTKRRYKTSKDIDIIEYISPNARYVKQYKSVMISNSVYMGCDFNFKVNYRF